MNYFEKLLNEFHSRILWENEHVIEGIESSQNGELLHIYELKSLSDCLVPMHINHSEILTIREDSEANFGHFGAQMIDKDQIVNGILNVLCIVVPVK